LENSRPKPGRMEETLEGGWGPPRAVEPLERERITGGIVKITVTVTVITDMCNW